MHISKKKNNVVALGVLASGYELDESGDEEGEEYGYHGEETEFQQHPDEIVMAFV